jgi:hypothetical protein
MKIITGHVVNGTIVVEGERLEEGTTVTVLAKEDDETFQLSPQDEAELLVAIDQANRGDVVSGDELLRQLTNPE